MRHRVWHRTTYSYDDDVTDSLGVAYLTPRELPWQRVVSHRLDVDPAPADRSEDVDHHGNRTTYFQVTAPHRALVVTAESVVEVDDTAHDDAALAVPWEDARPLDPPPGRPVAVDAWEATDFVLPTAAVPHADGARAYAATSLRPGRPLGEAVTELVARVHADFRYDPTATTVTSTVAETLEQRAGVCQDFAHLLLACLRSHGLAARYVSGYLATEPAPGRERVFGADASHAWVAVWVPARDPGAPGEWLALDPTNDQRAGERYVTVAWGRDYGDVPPLKGVIVTEARRSELLVEVDVSPTG